MPRRTNPTSARRPRLLAVDLDGTLLDRTGQPHQEDLAAMKRLAASGAHVTIATGRLYSGTRVHAQTLGITGPVACADGSHFVRVADHRTLLHHGVPQAAAQRLHAKIVEHAPVTLLFAGDKIVHDERSDPFLAYISTWSNDLVRSPSVTDESIWTNDNALTGAVALGTEAQINGIVDALETELAEQLQFARFPLRQLPGMFGMMARAKVGTKGSALAWLAKHHDVQMDETVCVGDWHNDVPMLEVAGRSFAMGQAPDDVKEAATHVLAETSETGGGIARIVKDVFGV